VIDEVVCVSFARKVCNLRIEGARVIVVKAHPWHRSCMVAAYDCEFVGRCPGGPMAVNVMHKSRA
jgi:hypothetical protein